MVTLVKEIGSDALFALAARARGRRARGVRRAFYEHCRDGDLAVAVAQTDVKGDRSLPPHAQADPDLYVHVVEERADGIVVRGAKCHTSTSGQRARDHRAAHAGRWAPTTPTTRCRSRYPSTRPACRSTCRRTVQRDRDEFEFPVSSKHKMLETLTVFDDVFVPWERVFLCRQSRARRTARDGLRGVPPLHRGVLQAPAARRAGRHGRAGRRDERRGQAGHMQREAHPARDLRGDGPGAHRVGRACVHASTTPASPSPTRSPPTWPSTRSPRVPRTRSSWCRTAPAASWSPARAAPTGPTPRCGRCSRSSSREAAPAEERLRLLNTIADLTARDFGGYQAVLAVHAEGSIEAEKMQIFRSYDPGRAMGYARRLAGIEEEPGN